MDLRAFEFQTEHALAAMARNYVVASNDLNPFVEAQILDLEPAVAAYAGTFSPIHGVIGLGLGHPVVPEEIEDIDRFFQRKERAPFWETSPSTEPSLLEHIRSHGFGVFEEQTVLGLELKNIPDEAFPPGITAEPDHGVWAQTHTRSHRPEASGPDLFSTVLMHMRSTRYYLQSEPKPDAAFTVFQDGLALTMARPLLQDSLLHAQLQHAARFKCRALALVVRPGTVRPTEAMPGFPWTFSYTRKIWKPS